MQITTIGLDIAKNVFQVHGIDAAEKVVVRKQLRRGQVMKFFAALPPCLIGMEACATAHYWARELTRLGHEVRLMPAKDVSIRKSIRSDSIVAHFCPQAVPRRLLQQYPPKPDSCTAAKIVPIRSPRRQHHRARHPSRALSGARSLRAILTRRTVAPGRPGLAGVVRRVRSGRSPRPGRFDTSGPPTGNNDSSARAARRIAG